MTQRPSIALFGDSITQFSFSEGGWGACLADTYQRRADILNRGYSGYNTRWALRLLEQVFPESREPPVAATMFFGANDAALPDGCAARQHVPVAEYKENLARMVAVVRSRGVRSIILITPPPVHEPARLEDLRARGEQGVELPERTNEAVGQYARAVCEVAQDLDAPVVNLWKAFQQQEGWQTSLLNDGLHLTAAGNALVFQELMAAIGSDPRLADLDPEAIPFDGPYHRDIDPTNPGLAFNL